MNQSESIEKLIECFRNLPSVGYKTAERYVYKIISMSNEEARFFAEAIKEVKENVVECKECGNYTDKEICDICTKRKTEVICVVKEPKDVIAMEKVKNFIGVYHVLHGTISPMDNKGPNDIRIKELVERVNKYRTKEVIMALNPDVEGDVTATYIARLLKPLNIKVTKLAQGISMGSDIEYADEVTLSRAMEARREIE